MCFCVLPLWSCAPFGLSVLPAWLPCQNVLPADLHAIPFARNTQQVLVFAAPVANACCPLLYSCRSITFATVAKPISLSFDGSSVAGATLALTVRFPIFVTHHHGPHGLVLRLSCPGLCQCSKFGIAAATSVDCVAASAATMLLLSPLPCLAVLQLCVCRRNAASLLNSHTTQHSTFLSAKKRSITSARGLHEKNLRRNA